MTKPFLSLCMIVRDAGETIEALLKSVDGAFDEYVIVDTGSVDDTREKVLCFFREHIAGDRFGVMGAQFALERMTRPPEVVERGDKRFVFASFDWIDDFAAARNYSYSLATGRWRMYLDADDTFEDASPKNGKSLREALRSLEERAPHVNSVSIPYAYAKDDTQQDVTFRITKWDETTNWAWEDEIHEHLVNRAGHRMISNFVDRTVVHNRPAHTVADAYTRNKRIAQRVYDNPGVMPEKRARFAYHLAQSFKFEGNFAQATEKLREVLAVYGDTNFGAYAYSDIIRMLVDENRLSDALQVAGEMQARLPEFREADMLAGMVHARQGSWLRAATLFDQAFNKSKLALSSYEDIWFTTGYIPTIAAQAYFEVGRYDDARKQLESVPASMVLRSDVQPVFSRVQSNLMKERGLKVLNDFIDYLIWDTEAPKAVKALTHCIPAAIATEPAVAQRLREIEKKLGHLEGWEQYKAHYASIPDNTYHTDAHNRENTLLLYRAQALLNWAKALPADGPPIRMAAIGFQDGIIEREAMRACGRLHLTVVDVAPQSSQGFKMLKDEFGDRVDSHDMVHHHCDWLAENARESFDVVVIFEVLEHVPDQVTALHTLYSMLKEDGTLFLSTPVAARWVEPYLTDPKAGPPWYGHVRANNHVSLWSLLRSFDFDGLLTEGYDGVFVAQMKKVPRRYIVRTNKRPVSILVPGTPKPFDAFSHLHGFVGGSEECVIHLSARLAALGHAVTVYTPEPENFPIVRGYNGVSWRPAREFDPHGDHDSVLFWRSAQPIPEEAPYKSLLWLHDAFYGVPPSEYEKADNVIVLSDAHAKSITQYDGFAGPFDVLANGILEESFPPLGRDEQRDPHKIIYASSPDRGLSRLLDIWSALRVRVPDATLDIYYDWSGYKRMFPVEHDVLVKRLALLADHGVTYHGGVNHEELHQAFRRAGVWPYPNKGVVETFCITAVKAMASGCDVITSAAGALPEIVGSGGYVLDELNDNTIDTDEGMDAFYDAVAFALENPKKTEERERVRAQALERFGWRKVAQRFSKLIEEG